jgi:hypothetical protein
MKIFLIFTLFFINFWWVSALTCSLGWDNNSDIIFVWTLITSENIQTGTGAFSQVYEATATYKVEKMIKWKITDKIVIYTWPYSIWQWWIPHINGKSLVYASLRWDKYFSSFCAITKYVPLYWNYLLSWILLCWFFIYLYLHRKIKNFFIFQLKNKWKK